MSDQSQGPGWWQASDLKWYPPPAPGATPTAPTAPTASTGPTAPTASGQPYTPGQSYGPGPGPGPLDAHQFGSPHPPQYGPPANARPPQPFGPAPRVVAPQPMLPAGSATNFGKKAKKGATRSAGVVIALIVVAIVFVGGAVTWILLTQAERDDDGNVKDAGSLTIADLRVGDCFNEPDATEVVDVDAVPCDQAHDGEVIAVLAYEEAKGAPFPGEQNLDDRAALLCSAQFATYVGKPYDQSALALGNIRPTNESWLKAADRQLICYAGQTGTRLTGTVKGSAR